MTAGTSALLLAIGGGAAGVAYLSKDHAQRTTDAARTFSIAAPKGVAGQDAAPDQATGAGPGDAGLGAAGPGDAGLGDAGLGDAVKAATGDRTSDGEADRTATRGPAHTAPAAADAKPDAKDAGQAAANPATVDAPVNAPVGPVISTKTVSETRPIPFRTTFVRDPSMARGTSRMQTPGVDGVQTVRWLVTYADGQETGRRPIGSAVTRAPQHRVIVLGGQDRDWNGRGWGGRGWNDRGWDRPRECDTDPGPCVHLGGLDCPQQVQENSDELAGLGEGLSALSPDGELADVATPCR